MQSLDLVKTCWQSKDQNLPSSNISSDILELPHPRFKILSSRLTNCCCVSKVRKRPQSVMINQGIFV
jgi:hypothetical protein